MGDNSDYYNLVRQRNASEARLCAVRSEQRMTQERIERLERVRSTLYSCCDSYCSLNNNIKRTIKDTYQWKGENYNHFLSTGEALVTDSNSYYSNMDRARDAINDEITRLENELYNQMGLIGQLVSAINSLSNKIENFFN